MLKRYKRSFAAPEADGCERPGHATTHLREAQAHDGFDAHAPLEHMRRARRALSAGRRAVRRAESEEDLLREHCRAVARAGGYRAAWVGYAEADGSVRTMACCGSDVGRLEPTTMSGNDCDEGHCPTVTAIRSGLPVVVEDTRSEPRFGPWREAALGDGHLSCVALPLHLDGAVLGALTLYSDAPDAVAHETLSLLEETAGDLALGIGSVRHRAEHARMLRALEESEARCEASLRAMKA